MHFQVGGMVIKSFLRSTFASAFICHLEKIESVSSLFQINFFNVNMSRTKFYYLDIKVSCQCQIILIVNATI